MTTKTKDDKATEEFKCLTPEFRVSFPSVFTPQRPPDGSTGEPKYRVTMLFGKKQDITSLKQIANAAAVKKWGADKAKWPKGLRSPFRDGSEKDYEGYGADTVFCSASSKMKPGVVDQKVQPIIEPNEFYGGCYARATITAFAYDKAGNRGVSFGLRNVQKTRDGEPFSGASKPENDFDAIDVPSDAAGSGASAANDGGSGL